MRDMRTGRRGDQRRRPVYANRFEHARRLGGASLQLRQHPFPVRHLLGKETHVAEAGEAAQHRRGADLHRPAFRHRLVDAPAALVFVIVAGEHGVRLLPFALGCGRRPQGLRLGAVDNDGSEAFELAPGAAVEQRVVGKTGRLDELQPRRFARRRRRARVVAMTLIVLRHGQRLGASGRPCKALSRGLPALFINASGFGSHNKPALRD